jgi:hypothetical protein
MVIEGTASAASAVASKSSPMFIAFPLRNRNRHYV